MGILSDTPKLGYKFYMDLLLKRDSAVPEIDETGVELSTELIRKAFKQFSPTLTKMKSDYLNSLKESAIIQNVNLNLPANHGVPPGPLMFVRSTIPQSTQPDHSLPLLIDCGATNSCISLTNLHLLGIGEDKICTSIRYTLTNVTEQNNDKTIIGSIVLNTYIEVGQLKASLHVQYLVLKVSLSYNILGSLELEDFGAIICVPCKSLKIMLWKDSKIKWCKPTI